MSQLLARSPANSRNLFLGHRLGCCVYAAFSARLTTSNAAARHPSGNSRPGPLVNHPGSSFASEGSIRTYSRASPAHRQGPAPTPHPTPFTIPPRIDVAQRSRSNFSSGNMTSPVEGAKKLAAYQAVEDHLDASYRYVGIGSGSTVIYVVDAIASRGPEFYGSMLFFPTGSQSKALIMNAGLNLCNLPDRPLGPDGRPVMLDVAFDGADEVDADLNCIKGGGACLLQEKGVAIRAKKFVVVADYRKKSDRLCEKWKAGIPIEVDPFFARDLLGDLKDMGAINPLVRAGLPSKAGECVTDNGNWLIDAPFEPLLLPVDLARLSVEGKGTDGRWETGALASALKALPGVVETGLFYGINGLEAESSAQDGKRKTAQKPIAAYFGMENGEVEIRKAS